MRKNFKKIIATSLALCTFASTMTTTTFAMKPALPEPKSETAKTELDLESCIREFESIAPGVFCVDPYFSSPENTQPEITCRVLKQMTKIFKMFPNITQQFIEQVQDCTSEKKFTIKPMNEAYRELVSIGITGDITILGCYDETPETINIRIDVNKIFEENVKSNSSLSGANVERGTSNFIECSITHEMGHLFESAIEYSTIGCYDETPKTINSRIDLNNKIFEENVNLNSSLSSANVGRGTSNFIECSITHEMGHLFESVIEYSTIGKEAYKNYLSIITKYRNEILNNPACVKDEDSCKKIIQQIMRTTHIPEIPNCEEPTNEQIAEAFDKIINEKSKKIKEEIIGEAARSGTDAFVSFYGDTNAKEWFAELFARTFCIEEKAKTRTQAALDKAMIDYIQNFEGTVSAGVHVRRSYLPDKPLCLSLQESINLRDFENLAPDTFFIALEFSDPNSGYARIGNMIQHITLEFMIHPKIQEKFIKQIQECTRRRMFRIMPMNVDIAYQLTGRIVLDTLYYEDTDAFILFLDPDVLLELQRKIPKQIRRGLIQKDFSVSHSARDYTQCSIMLIMGQILHSVICYSKDEMLYKLRLNAISRLYHNIKDRATEKSKTEPKLTEPQLTEPQLTEPKLIELQLAELQLSKEDFDICKAYNKMSDEIKEEIIEIARTKYGYEGDGFISPCGEINSLCWFMEVFAHSKCCDDATALDSAMFDYIDFFEKSL